MPPSLGGRRLHASPRPGLPLKNWHIKMSLNTPPSSPLPLYPHLPLPRCGFLLGLCLRPLHSNLDVSCQMPYYFQHHCGLFSFSLSLARPLFFSLAALCFPRAGLRFVFLNCRFKPCAVICPFASARVLVKDVMFVLIVVPPSRGSPPKWSLARHQSFRRVTGETAGLPHL